MNKCEMPQSPTKAALVLSFRADGPYWNDLIHILAYPDGISYVWPFRYDAKYIEPNLLSLLNKGRSTFTGRRVLIAARFHADQESKQKLLPIREAIITHLDVFAGVYTFAFRLGRAFQFDSKTDLTSCTVPVVASANYLAFEESISSNLQQVTDSTSLSNSWKAFTELLAEEITLPINQKAKHSLFLHFMPPMHNGVPLPVSELPSVQGENAVFGYSFKQGERYQIKYAHNVPALSQTNSTISEIIIKPALPTNDIEPTAVESRIIGNYGVQELLLSAISKTAMYQKLLVGSVDKKLMSQNNTTINSTTFEIPLAAEWSLCRWLKHSFLPSLALFFVLTIIGISNLIDKVMSDLLKDEVSFGQLCSHWPLLLIVLIGSLLGSFVVPALFRRSIEK